MKYIDISPETHERLRKLSYELDLEMLKVVEFLMVQSGRKFEDMSEGLIHQCLFDNGL